MLKLVKIDTIGDNQKNYLFNGDNLEILEILEKKMSNKIKLIYIDPPYNTGKKMGKYNDNFGTHELWCEFIRPRLEISKKFLTDNGLIFISIGEKEIAHLKILCNEIFGEDNFVSNIVWQSKYTVANDKDGISCQTEYILVYAKNIDYLEIKNDPLDKEYINKSYKNLDNDPRGLWRSGVQLYKKKNKKTYTVVSPTGKKWTMPWNYNEEGWKKLEENKLIWWGQDGNSCPQKKVFLKNSKGKGIRNLWLGKDVGYTADGGNLLEQIMGNRNDFLYPKPLSLIERIINIASNDKDIIMDFFAGSGTTGHAVLNINKINNENRKFVLITNNENDICEEITLKRLKKVIKGYSFRKNEEKTKVDGTGGGFDYYILKNNEEKK